MTNPIVTLTPNACSKVEDLVSEHAANNNVVLRLYVAGGGCSGLQYGLSLDEEAEDLDSITTQDNIRIAIDPVSLKYVYGSTIDYIEDGLMGGFKVDNPNAVKTCGCSSSFSIEDTKDTEAQDVCNGCGFKSVV